MIPTHRNILLSREKDTSAWLNRLLRTRVNFSMLWCPLRLRHLVIYIILVFIDPDFIPPTHPTNVAGDSLHHGLVYGKLALPQRGKDRSVPHRGGGCTAK